MISATTSMTVAKRLVLTGAIAVSVCLVPAVARAQDRAEALFREGRAALDAKHYDEACPKLAESQKLEPGAGTLLALALCHEGQGKTATAYNELRDAAALGRKNGRADLASAADKHASVLEASLAKLVVQTPEGTAYDIRCDDEALPRERIGIAFPVNPGEHRIVASAKNKTDRSYVVRLIGAGTVEIVVDRLDDAPVAVAPAPVARPAAHVTPLTEPPPADAESGHGTGQRVLGYALVGLGVAGLGTGAYFGGRAISEHSDANRGCSTTPCPDASSANDRARSSLNASIVSVTVGTAAIGVGAILLLTAPSSPATKRTARVLPDAGPSRAGLTVVGAF
jgi:hypothetical protein